MLERSVSLFLNHPQIHELIVALPSEIAADPPPYLTRASKPLQIVTGGARRQDSVARAFEALSPATDVVVVHDAARPFASPDLLSRTIAAALDSGAAVAALAARDTVKRARAKDSVSYVAETLPRATIYLAQTPQAFRRAVLGEALSSSDPQVDATDEASLAERAGFAVRIVEGEPSNIKVTTPEDLEAAEKLAAQAPPAGPGRVGTGYDLHRLASGRPLMIGGIAVPADVGPVSHSDGDVVCHAIVDAILGGAALGDIGRHFPDSDPRWRDAAGLDLLARASALIAAAGFVVGNVDVTVILERPKIGEYVDKMCAAVAGALSIETNCVSIKGKTNEGVNAVGRGEAIAAQAVAFIVARGGGAPA
jgi:2-C-methyl-D-erythritol 4-phosphate cytidylyltransferase/2-C-methyl-D-erythritol 2,4-cyclodiphosphate synthase